MENNNHLFKIIKAAMLAALICVATMLINIPSPLGGYIHLGDGFVLLAGFVLGPVYGAASAGMGAMLADLMLGYTHYAAGTFLIKAAVAGIAALLYRWLGKRKCGNIACPVFSGIAGEVFMVLAYFLYEDILLRLGLSAAANIPANLLQATAGIAVATILVPLLKKAKII